MLSNVIFGKRHYTNHWQYLQLLCMAKQNIKHRVPYVLSISSYLAENSIVFISVLSLLNLKIHVPAVL